VVSGIQNSSFGRKLAGMVNELTLTDDVDTHQGRLAKT
jgi:hypothetical protein